MKNYQWFAFSGGGKGELLVGGQSWGMIVSVEKIPHDLPIEKPSKKRKLITQDKTVISAIPLRWEVLPPGWWRERGNNTKLLTSKQRLHYDRVERLKYIDSLNPEKVYLGKNYLGERIYYVAVFKSCVVAESATYGNAAYFVFDIENWQKILSHSKKDVLKLNDAVLRVPHIFDWRTKIANVIRNVRGHPKPVDIL
jgi:hypothetical protein